MIFSKRIQHIDSIGQVVVMNFTIHKLKCFIELFFVLTDFHI